MLLRFAYETPANFNDLASTCGSQVGDASGIGNILYAAEGMDTLLLAAQSRAVANEFPVAVV
jgi:hypothetical protein